MRPRWFLLLALGVVRTSMGPKPTGVTPATVPVAGKIHVHVMELADPSYVAVLRYTKKYRATSGEPDTATIASDVTTAEPAYVFRAPANLRPTELLLRFRLASGGSDTSALGRATFSIPGRLDVLETPIVLEGSPLGFDAWMTLGAAGLIIPPGTVNIPGKNFVPPPGHQTSVTFNGQTLTQTSPPRYDPAANNGRGGDFITLQIPEPSVSTMGTLSVTTPGGTGTRTNVLMARLGRVTAVEELNTAGSVVGPANGRLVRGRRYQIRGTELAYPAGPPLILESTVFLGGTMLSAADSTLDATRVWFTVPATFAGGSATLAVRTFAGSVSVGTFAISDPGMAPPPLANVVVAPAPAARGSVLTTTIAFAGAVPPGADLGNVIVSGSTDFVGLPLTVPITANPMTISTTTRVRSTTGTAGLRVRLSRSSGGTDSLDRSIQLVPPAMTGFSLATPTITGPNTATAQVTFDFPAGASLSCGTAFNPTPDVRIDVESSDTSVASVPGNNLPWSTGVCVRHNPAPVLIETKPVTTARTVTLTARFLETTKTASLTVTPPMLTAVSVDRAALTSMQSATGTLTMSFAQPNAVAFVQSSDPSVSVPAKVPLASTAQTTFPITTLPVSSSRSVTISAVVNGVTQSATVTLEPLRITTVSLSPSSVRAGSSAAATLLLNTPVNVPLSVNLSSSDPTVATVPASVTFAAGQSAAVFSVQAVAGQQQAKTVTITATSSVTLPNGTPVTTTQTGTLTVTP